MKKILPQFSVLSVVILALSALVFAQNTQKTSTVAQNYVISAKAGGVNYVEGRIAVLRKDGKSGYLVKGDTLEIGDKVSTEVGGKAEILLNPGSYIRLDENTGFEFENTSLDDLKLKLSRGSAMLEVFADDEFKVTVSTPKTQFYAIKSGVYRVDVINDGTAKIEVWKGKAQVGDMNATVLKGGRGAVVNQNQVAVAKFDRDERDGLEVWSKNRAKELAKLNAKLERKVLRTTLLNSFYGRGWNVYNSFGLWIYDASFGRFCFLPFGYGWSSPYGYYFGSSIWSYNLPWSIFYQRPWWNSNPGNNNGNNGGNNGGGNNNATTPPRTTPPFERIRNNRGKDGRDLDIMKPLERNYDTPMRINPTPSAPPASMPSSPPVERIETPMRKGNPKVD